MFINNDSSLSYSRMKNNEHNNLDVKAAQELAKLDLLEKSIVYYVRMAILICLPSLCLVVLCTFALHLVLPNTWQWLTGDHPALINPRQVQWQVRR